MSRQIATCTLALVVFRFGGMAQERLPVSLPLHRDGSIPAWYVAGPFEQPMTGFGVWSDADSIGEETVSPFEGKREATSLSPSGASTWRAQSVDSRGYLDLNASLGWEVPGPTPEKVWWAKAGYAFARLEVFDAQEALLLVGSNSQLSILLNGKRVHSFKGDRGATPDNDTVRVVLRKGTNTLLLKIGNTHRNHGLHFFGGSPWGWGGYARLVDPRKKALSNVTAGFDVAPASPAMSIRSTFFFRQSAQGLLQRFDLILFSPDTGHAAGRIQIEAGGTRERFDLRDVRFGWNRIPLWYPADDRDRAATCRLEMRGRVSTAVETLRVEKHYELHLMQLTHTDIGYTHPQPVVKELHCIALDDVLAMCRTNPEFRWTIETVWQLQQFERSRLPTVSQELRNYIREGRIAVSPVYTNPFTGWVSEEEMIRSLFRAREYKERWGIAYAGAVYNDVPGVAWFTPRVLRDAGVGLLACGLNEVYGGYTLQRSLPKAFRWIGADSSSVIVYRNETYSEGTAYGLESDQDAAAHRMWERLNKLRASGGDFDMVLLNAGQFDNGGVAKTQFAAAQRWNKEYAYPRFVFATISSFASEFEKRHGSTLPSMRGDWTSAWDMLHQGEPARVVRERWCQQQLLQAEAFDALSTLLDPNVAPARNLINHAYSSLQQYSGHGSGLEFGYGTPTENAVTMTYREQYVRDAVSATTEVLSRAMTRLVKPETSFEGEGIIVFNPLSWRCDIPLELELKDSSTQQFWLVDLATGRDVPSFRAGHNLLFVAPAVPPLGFKKFSLRQLRAGSTMPWSGLIISATTIENRYYTITIDPGTRRVVSIRDKKTYRELIRKGSVPFNEPLVRRMYVDDAFTAASAEGVDIIMRDERPARVTLVVKRRNHLFESSEYRLWSEVDRVDVVHNVDLGQLRAPEQAEEYVVGFPFALAGSGVRVDILGGNLRIPGERLPGALNDVVSIRRSAGVAEEEYMVAWATVDGRVAYWKSATRGRSPIILANIVNNFPTQWNRNEENKGILKYRFAFRSLPTRYDAETTARLGWEANTEFFAYRTWLRSAPAETSYMSVAGRNVLLTTLKTGESGSGLVIRLVNVSPDSAARAVVSSPLLRTMKAFAGNLYEERGTEIPMLAASVEVFLRPSETKTVLFEKRPH
jgi:alpha-mannosidase